MALQPTINPNIVPLRHPQNTLTTPPPSTHRTSAQRWTAIQSRDTTANTSFYYGVTTTHIFCRPTCLGRVARKANVIFFDDLTAARAIGYRACKRCKPEEGSWSREGAGRRIVAEGQRVIRGAVDRGDVWTVEGVSARLGVTAGHLHRLFRRFLGVTPKGFAAGVIRGVHVPRSPNLTPGVRVGDLNEFVHGQSYQEFDSLEDSVELDKGTVSWGETLQDFEGVSWTEWLTLEHIDQDQTLVGA